MLSAAHGLCCIASTSKHGLKRPQCPCCHSPCVLQPYFAAPDFNYDSAKKASGNVAGLCNWSEAMQRYHEIAKVRSPHQVARQEPCILQ
jgi:hypothetical protein